MERLRHVVATLDGSLGRTVTFFGWFGMGWLDGWMGWLDGWMGWLDGWMGWLNVCWINILDVAFFGYSLV